LKYHHLGIPTLTPRAGEAYVPHLKIHCTDHASNPFGLQWMRYDPDCSLPEAVKTLPHAAFEVDDLEEAMKGHQVIIEPNNPSDGVRVAFVLCDGAPVEFLEIRKT
jgi:hypothetical protein